MDLTSTYVQALAIVAPLGGVILGGAFTWIGQDWKERRERKIAVGKALADLLDVRHQLFAMDKGIAAIQAHPTFAPEAALQVRNLSDEFFASGGELVGRYNNAVSALAGHDPVLAYWLRSKELIPNVLGRLRRLNIESGLDAKSVESLEVDAREAAKKCLDEAIQELAKLHSWSTARRVKNLFPAEDREISEFAEKVLSKLIPEK